MREASRRRRLMTIEARRILNDCNLALEMLESEDAHDRWRVLWAGAIALTRAVGHVLQGVDGSRNAELLRLSNEAWARWRTEPQHLIFMNFIKPERDLLLKEYKSNVEGGVDVYGITFIDENGLEKIESIDAILYRPIMNGHYAGEDARDVLRAALDWWAQELDALDIALAS